MQTLRVCACREVLLALGVRAKELNDQVWPKVRDKGFTWAELKTVLEQLVANKLAAQEYRRVEGCRMTFFYTLTAAGQKRKSELLSGEEKNANATPCGEKCCLNKKAA